MSSARAKLHINGNRIGINAYNSNKKFSEHNISIRTSTAKPHCDKKLYQVSAAGEITQWNNISKMAEAV